MLIIGLKYFQGAVLNSESYSTNSARKNMQARTNYTRECAPHISRQLLFYWFRLFEYSWAPLQEAQQRENRLHDKLEELQLVVGKLEVACNETLTNRFEETRLLSKIANLEKQTKVMSKAMSGGGKASEKVEAEVQQLLGDIEKLQNVARDIQERQHRKLLESEQKLIEAQRYPTHYKSNSLSFNPISTN